MTRRYFGTDGIRGQVGAAPMTVDFALRLASAAAHVLAPQGGTVLIGKDTRVSGYMFESALEAGFVAAGVDLVYVGPNTGFTGPRGVVQVLWNHDNHLHVRIRATTD